MNTNRVYMLLTLTGLNGLGYMLIIAYVLLEGMDFFSWFMTFLNLLLTICTFDELREWKNEILKR